MSIQFKEYNIYFLETEEDVERVLFNENYYPLFQDSELDFSEKVGVVKNKIESMLNKKLEWGNSSLDFLEKHSEQELDQKPFSDLMAEYDSDIFKDIIATLGTELNNIQENIEEEKNRKPEWKNSLSDILKINI